jgi:hypothetical protein
MEKNQKPIVLAEFFERRTVSYYAGAREVWVCVRIMNVPESRQAYKNRPFSKNAESRFGGDSYRDDWWLLQHKMAAKCKMCQAVTKMYILDNSICPDCDGRTEYTGDDPHRSE